MSASECLVSFIPPLDKSQLGLSNYKIGSLNKILLIILDFRLRETIKNQNDLFQISYF